MGLWNIDILEVRAGTYSPQQPKARGQAAVTRILAFAISITTFSGDLHGTGIGSKRHN